MDKTEGSNTRRVRGSDRVAILDDNDDLDAGEKTIVDFQLGSAVFCSIPPAFDVSSVKHDIMLRRVTGWVMDFITRRARARTRQDHDYEV